MRPLCHSRVAAVGHGPPWRPRQDAPSLAGRRRSPHAQLRRMLGATKSTQERVVKLNSFRYAVGVLALLLAGSVVAADVPGSSDPPGMQRYEGSVLIGYRAPQFDEYRVPLARPTSISPPAYEDSADLEGMVSRYTYLVPAGRSAAEIFRNYKLEFERLDLETVYEKSAGAPGWFGPTFQQHANEDGLGQILGYHEAQERMLVARSKDASPTWYQVFVTTYRDGVVPERLRDVLQKDQGLVHLVVIAPEQMQQRMAFVTAPEMSRSLADTGRVVLDGLYFDTDRDTIRGDSQPLLEEIARLLKDNPQLRVHVVGHTDSVGAVEYNLDLSRRRAASVVRELTGKHGIGTERLGSFGAGPYAPVAANGDDAGRARNRRVELVQW
jgi:OmpA-OmpF porin, OOP family